MSSPSAPAAVRRDPRIFEAALSALGASPGAAVFVEGSMPRDMAGARGIGMPHVWFAPGQSCACCAADFVNDSPARLPEVLR
jgi:FMN phosphatase YigB (HAD superfamily)